MTLPTSQISEPVATYLSQPPHERRPWALTEIIAWTIIIILAALTAVGAAMDQARSAAAPDKAPMLTFISQYALGVHEMTKGGGGMFAGGTTDAGLMRELDATAKVPEDRLKLAILAGELQGPAETLRRLESLSGDTEVEHDADIVRQLYSDDAPAETDVPGFRVRYGWFADLALSTGGPPGNPDRVRALQAAYRALGGLMAVALTAIGGAGLGLILLIIGLIFLFMGKIKPAFRPGANLQPPQDRRTELEGFACYMVGMIGLSLVLHRILNLTIRDTSPALLALVEILALGSAFAAGIAWPRLRGQSATDWRAALGLHAGKGLFREIGSGILGYLAGLPILAAGIFITALLAKFSGTTANHPINDVLNKGIGWLIAAFVLASIWAPITEEIMFRGALFASLRERFGWGISAPIVALVFAIIHPQGWVAVPALASIALVLAGIREWRGSVIGCVTAHALHNTLTLAVAMLFLRAA